jgi:hypothetical protein
MRVENVFGEERSSAQMPPQVCIGKHGVVATAEKGAQTEGGGRGRRVQPTSSSGEHTPTNSLSSSSSRELALENLEFKALQKRVEQQQKQGGGQPQPPQQPSAQTSSPSSDQQHQQQQQTWGVVPVGLETEAAEVVLANELRLKQVCLVCSCL